jgi:hypothetical protein
MERAAIIAARFVLVHGHGGLEPPSQQGVQVGAQLACAMAGQARHDRKETGAPAK